MKKILFIVIMAAYATGINAQLVVDSLGRVGIGTETPLVPLSIGTSTDTLSTMFCHTSSRTYGVYAKNNHNYNDSSTYSIYSLAQNNTGSGYGVRAIALGNSNVNSSKQAIGVNGCASGAYTSIGLLGGKMGGTVVNFAGVYGAETTTTPSFTNYSGTYAGFFKGKVRVTNGIFATVLSPSASPSPSGEGGATTLSDRGESVTDKLSQVQAVQFLRYDSTKVTKTEKPSSTEIDIDNMSPEELDSLAARTDEEPERYLSPIQYGLAADQLKAVYPELVYEDANGNVSINYVEMIPLLVQSIKELSAKVETLEQQLGAKKSTRKSKQQTTAVEKTNGINLPKDGTTYDLSGRLVANPQHGVYVQNGKKVAVK